MLTMSIQATYIARIEPVVGGSMIDVSFQASDVWQSRKLIESICGPIKVWQMCPNRVSG
jgi:hypothetical protein